MGRVGQEVVVAMVVVEGDEVEMISRGKVE